MIEKEILGVKVHFNMTMAEVVSKIDSFLQDGTSHYICTTNPEFIIEAQKDTEFKDIINKASLSVPDGVGVLSAYNYLNTPINNHNILLYPLLSAGSLIKNLFRRSEYSPIYGVNLMMELTGLAQSKGYSIGLLGGWPKDFFGKAKLGNFNVASDAAAVILKKYPDLNIPIATSYIDYKNTSDIESVNLIHKAMKESALTSLDIVFVAFGHSKQEKWIVRNIDKIPAKLCIGVGGSFDDVANYIPQTPKFFLKLNLKWLYRLIIQPWRYKRIVNAVIKFPWLIYLYSLNQHKSYLESESH